MTEQKRLTLKNDKLLKFEMFNQAAENFDSNNIWLQFRAIRLLIGISKDNEDLLDWICENNYSLLEDIAEKLSHKIQKGNDEVIINEAKMLIEVLKPYLNNSKSAVLINLNCHKCGREIKFGWNHCITCGSKIYWDGNYICPQCSKPIHPEWKLCPECGQDLEHNYCLSCKERLELSWKICPFCGNKTD